MNLKKSAQFQPGSTQLGNFSAQLGSAENFSSNPSLKYPFPNHSLIKIINFLISKTVKDKVNCGDGDIFIVDNCETCGSLDFCNGDCKWSNGNCVPGKLSKELVNRQSKFFFLSIRWEWKCALIFSNYWAFHCILVTWFLVVFGCLWWRSYQNIM